MSGRPPDLSLPPDLHLKGGTGPARTRRPIYVDLRAPCEHACPAGENVQAWLAHAQAGRYREAWEEIVSRNPLPAVHGRVCYHPCESACNRVPLDHAVGVHSVERFLGDLALREGWLPRMEPSSSGARVLVIGAGPSGLSAAWHLLRAGHQVEVRDGGAAAGGMMRYGIPAYRLPRAVLDGEVERIARAGVKFVPNHRVEDLEHERRDGGFDAVFIAVGAHLSKRVEIPARDAGRILDAVGFLRDVEGGTPPRLGRRVAVYGGGNTAMDAARTAVRLGHEPMIVYRRDRAHMPAHDFEATEAEEEGVRIHWLRTIHSLEGAKLRVEVMALDDRGRPVPTGEFETLEADDLILALGQDSESDFLRAIEGVAVRADGTVEVDDRLMTGCPGIFAGGDMIPAERSVTHAVGHGRRAALSIESWLRGTSLVDEQSAAIATFDSLHLWFYTEAAHRPEPKSSLTRRTTSFSEVVGGLTAAEATFEARRCLSCGHCFECDGCYGACPEDAVIKLGPGLQYRFDYDLCTGCAVCFEQCPCHAIDMVPEIAAVPS
jgi:NADPH-dependent glutamate synthase beta subunit-like oxidoreductase